MEQSKQGFEVQHFASVPISNFIKVYSQVEGVIVDIKDMSVREVEKWTKTFLKENYIEPIQYVLKTENIFPLDFDEDDESNQRKSMEDFDRLAVHPDRVIR